jgi:hypothetical protein
MEIGTLEEVIDDDHAIISTTYGPNMYVTVPSFVDKDQLEPSQSVFLHNQSNFFLLAPPLIFTSPFSHRSDGRISRSDAQRHESRQGAP